MSIREKPTPKYEETLTNNTIAFLFCALCFIIVIFCVFLWFSFCNIIGAIKNVNQTIYAPRNYHNLATATLERDRFFIQQMYQQIKRENKWLTAIEKVNAKNQEFSQRLLAIQRLLYPPQKQKSIKTTTQQTSPSASEKVQQQFKIKEDNKKYLKSNGQSTNKKSTNDHENMKQNVNESQPKYQFVDLEARNAQSLILQRIMKSGAVAIQWWGSFL